MLLPLLRQLEPRAEFSAASQSSIADQRLVRLGRDNNADPSGQEVRVRLREARGPSIPRALPQADSRRADRLARAHGLALARVQALAHVRALALVRVQAARQLLKVLLARNAPLRAAAAVASSSTRRPKKAR
jgi:hypothetical protein